MSCLGKIPVSLLHVYELSHVSVNGYDCELIKVIKRRSMEYTYTYT